MNNITEHCIEFSFKGGGEAVTEISERDPSLFESCGIIDSFIFFDRIIKDDGEILEDRVNVSPRYYYGNRITKNEYVKLAIDTGEYDVNLLTNKKVNSVIVLETGNVIVNPSSDSVTLEEYKKSLEHTKIIPFQKYKKRK